MKIKVTSEQGFLEALNVIKQCGLNLLQIAKEVSLEVTKTVETRSNAQNRYYFEFNSWVRDTLNKAGMTYGEHELPYTTELVHEINKKIFGHETTRKMSVEEFCDYITQVSAFWIEKTNGNLEIPELPMEYLNRRGFTKDYIRSINGR
ncbi:MAG: hypothetical protein UE295_06510 [Acutalibacteraceae bacterium]|nr:hypothetical protein [Acutalibacteraceae bacterium]